jgi:hypothetical protein
MGKLEQLDKKAESTMLLPHERDIKHCLNAQLIQLLREEEIKWHKRSKSNSLKIKWYQRSKSNRLLRKVLPHGS